MRKGVPEFAQRSKIMIVSRTGIVLEKVLDLCGKRDRWSIAWFFRFKVRGLGFFTVLS